MKISSKDKKALIVLLIVLFFAVVYFFGIRPLEEKNLVLQQELIQKESMVNEITTTIASEPDVDSEQERYLTLIRDKSTYFYTDIEQQDFIYLLRSNAANTNFEIVDISFKEEMLNDTENAVLASMVSFRSDFGSLMQYIKNMKSMPKDTYITEVRIENDGTGYVSGDIQFEIATLPELSDYFDSDRHYVTSNGDYSEVMNPFEPYEGYIKEETPEEPIDTDPFGEIVIPHYEIYGFEDSQVFFVGNPRDVVGQVSLSSNAISGRKSTSLLYDFRSAKEVNVANLVFDGELITLNKQPQTIGVWLYAYAATNHKLGLVLEDAAGRQFDLELIANINWTGWQEVSAFVPMEITYPCVVRRIYVQAPDFESSLTGHVLFDKLEITYPVD